MEIAVQKKHTPYYFTHHAKHYVAYDTFGARITRLLRDIDDKYKLQEQDTSKYTYYMLLIENLENQFVRWFNEGRHNGAIKLVGIKVMARRKAA